MLLWVTSGKQIQSMLNTTSQRYSVIRQPKSSSIDSTTSLARLDAGVPYRHRSTPSARHLNSAARHTASGAMAGPHANQTSELIAAFDDVDGSAPGFCNGIETLEIAMRAAQLGFSNFSQSQVSCLGSANSSPHWTPPRWWHMSSRPPLQSCSLCMCC